MAIFLHSVLDLKHFVERPWHDTVHLVGWSSHGICLTRPCLSVGEYANIEAVHSRLNEHLGILKHFFLASLRAEAGIEHVLLLHILTLLAALALLVELLILLYSDFQSKLINNSDSIHAITSYFRLVHWSHSAVNSYLTLHVFDHIV